MCGRFTLGTNPSDLVEVFALLREPELTPRFNIPPTTQIAVIRQSGKDRELTEMRWAWCRVGRKTRRLGRRSSMPARYTPRLHSCAEIQWCVEAFAAAHLKRVLVIGRHGVTRSRTEHFGSCDREAPR